MTKVNQLKDMMKAKKEAADRKSTINTKVEQQSAKIDEDNQQNADQSAEEITSQIKAAESEAKEHYDKLLRVMAEFDNYKKRIEREKEIQEIQHSAAREAYARWIAYDWASKENPYLQKKGIEPLGVREDLDGNLLVPVQNADRALRGLQRISPEGEKRFLPGMEKNGNFHLITGENFDSEKDLAQGEIILAEGYATGASLHMATEKPVAVAFDAGNLEPVARKLREKYPNAAITICADNDHQHTRRTSEGTELWNKGVALAQDAAKAVGGKVVAPIFNEEERARGLTDFNDLHQSRGLDEVKRQVGLALQKDTEKEKSRSQGREIGMSI